MHLNKISNAIFNLCLYKVVIILLLKVWVGINKLTIICIVLIQMEFTDGNIEI